jgi:hypothetical protein
MNFRYLSTPSYNIVGMNSYTFLFTVCCPADAVPCHRICLVPLREGARDRYNRARRRKGDSISERRSFHKGLVLLCRDKYDKLLACMQIVNNTDKSVRQRYPATYFVYDLHLSGCQREFDGGQLKDSMAVRYVMRSGSGHLAPSIICGVRNQAIATITE